MKKIIATICCIFLLPLASPAAWKNIDTLKVAVYEFSLQTKSPEINPALLSDALAGELQKLNTFTIVERSLVKKIYEEKNMEMSGLTESEVSKLGAMMGADKIISGSISRVKDKWILSIKGLDVKTGKLDIYDQIYGYSMEDLLESMPLEANRILLLAKGGTLEKFNAKEKLVKENTKDMPADGLVLYMPMDGNAKDLSASKNSGAAVGCSLVNDRFGREKNAYHFKEQIAYIATAKKISGIKSYSLVIWVRTESPDGGRIIGMGDRAEGMSDTRDRQLYMNTSGKIYFGMMTADKKPAAVKSFETCNDGQWHCVAGVYADGIMKLFVDGELIESSKEKITPMNAEGFWRVGYDHLAVWPGEPSRYTLNGDVDDLRIYSRALNEAEIKMLYHQNGFARDKK